MKDITDKNFGVIIAFLLPGFLFLWGLSFSVDEGSEEQDISLCLARVEYSPDHMGLVNQNKEIRANPESLEECRKDRVFWMHCRFDSAAGLGPG